MFKTLLLAVACLIPSVGSAQTIVTSPTELIDNSPETPGIIVNKAKTTPQVKVGTVIFPCAGTENPWQYSVGVPCPASNAIAPPVVTAECKDLGASAQWTYASKGGTYGNACLLRTMDAVPLDGALDEPRVFQDVTLAASRHFITQKSTAWKPFANVTVQRVDVNSRKRGIFIRGGSHDWTIQDFRITGIGVNTAVGDIPVGIGMSGAHNITIRRGEVSAFQTKLSTDNYENADCISNERGDSATITYVYGHHCTDGIFDLKGTTYLDQTRAAYAGHYNYRFWATITAGTLISEYPGYAHIQLASATSNVTIDKLVVVGGGTLVKVDKAGGKMIVKLCDLTKWTGTTMKSGASATISWGEGCKVPVR